MLVIRNLHTLWHCLSIRRNYCILHSRDPNTFTVKIVFKDEKIGIMLHCEIYTLVINGLSMKLRW